RVARRQATVVSSRAKLVTPGTSCLVTCWAIAGATAISAIAIERDARMRVAPLRAHHATKRADRATGRACAARRGGYRRKMADPACCGKGDHPVAAAQLDARLQREVGAEPDLCGLCGLCVPVDTLARHAQREKWPGGKYYCSSAARIGWRFLANGLTTVTPLHVKPS